MVPTRHTQVHRSRRSPPVAARLRFVEHTVGMVDPGTPGGYIVFATTARVITVTPQSAATLTDRRIGGVSFASRADRRHWEAAGRPAIPVPSTTPSVTNFAAGTFGFLPKAGPPLTFHDVRELGVTPSVVRSAMGAHMPRSPQPATVLQEYGLLLAWGAPLARRSRAALVLALLETPGVRACGIRRDPTRRELTVCADSPDEEVSVTLDRVTGRVSAFAERLTRASPAFPGLRAPRVVDFDRFDST